MKYLVLLTSLSIFPAWPAVKLLGLNSSGQEVEQAVENKVFRDRLTSVIYAIEKEAVAELTRKDKFALNLSEVRVGASLAASLGLGEIVKLKAEPSFYLIIKK